MTVARRLASLAFVAAALAVMAFVVARLFQRSSRDEGALTPAAAAGEAFAIEKLTASDRVFDPAARTEAGQIAVTEPSSPADPTAVRFTVRARCVDADQKPLEGAKLALFSYEILDGSTRGRRISPSNGVDVPSAESGADGRIELTFEPEGSARVVQVTVACSRAGYVRTTPGRDVSVGAMEIDLGEIILARGAAIAGRLLEATGLPLAGENVLASTPQGSGWVGAHPPATSGVDGSFEIPDAPSGWLRIQAWLRDGRASSAVDVDVAPGGRHDGVELVAPIYEDPNAITGVVLDIDGTPAADAKVLARGTRADSSGGGKSMSNASVHADERGRFRFDGKPGSVFTLRAEHARGERTPALVDGIAIGTHGITLRLEPGRTFELVVLDETGAPVLEYGWTLWVEKENVRRGVDTSKPAMRANGRAQLHADAEAFTLEVNATGCEGATVGPFVPGTLPEIVEVRERRVPALRGLVLAGGVPRAGAAVELLAAAKPGESAFAGSFPLVMWPVREVARSTSDADGRFELYPNAPGEWFVRAEARDLAPGFAGPITVGASGTTGEVKIELSAGGAIEGIVQNLERASPKSVLVGVSRGDGFARLIDVGPDSRFRFEGLTPGWWHVRAAQHKQDGRGTPTSTSTRYGAAGSPEARPIDWDCEVREGETTRFDVVLDEPAILRVRMSPAWAAVGAWGGRTSVSAPNRDSTRREFRQGKQSGTFVAEMPHAGAGDWDLRAESGGASVTLSATLDLMPGDNEVVLERPLGRVHGRVANVDDKRPLSFLWSEGATSFRASIPISADGTFSLPFAPAGSGKLRRSAGASPAIERAVDVSAGEDLDVGEL